MLGLRIKNCVLCGVLSAGLAVNCALPVMGEVTLGPASPVSPIEVELGDGQQELGIEISNPALSLAELRLPMALEETATGKRLSVVWRFDPYDTNQVTPDGVLVL